MLNIILSLIVIILFYSVLLLLGKIVERVRSLKGEELDYKNQSSTHKLLFTIYGILFFTAFFASFKFMSYAILPEAASNWGVEIERLFVVTTVITGIIFILTHIALFYFVWKYSEREGSKATFFAHSNKLEAIWTTIPALAMAVLVIMGLKTWFNVFPNGKEKPANEMQIEVTAKQFNWTVRYPGKDGIFGRRIASKEYISQDNELGIDWSDPASHDDFFASDLHMVKGRPVYFKLGALDVLHSFYLPHFKMKMDCVPGVPTGIGFTPTKTNDETRELLKSNPHWAANDPETNEPRYKKFTYELACTELCGKSHYGMMTPVVVESQAEFDKWAATQKPYYEANKEKVNEMLAKWGKNGTNLTAQEPKSLDVKNLLAKAIDANAVYVSEGIQFAPNSAELDPKGKEALDLITELLKKYADKSVNLSVHTDSDGDDYKNMELSAKRADACKAYFAEKGLVATRVGAKGFGETKPIADNTTAEGKQRNRRTEFDFN
jgi:cytochrome c oxidase subunit II